MICKHCGGDIIRFRQVNANGAKVVIFCCSNCKRIPSGSSFGKRSEDWEDLPLFADYTKDAEPCVVLNCKNSGSELHHTAPVSIFGELSEDWPKYHLCLFHHRQWHDRTGVADGKRN